jgi:hypothetical protein
MTPRRCNGTLDVVEDAPQGLSAPRAEHDHVIQTLSLQCADDAFGNRVREVTARAWRWRRWRYFAHAGGSREYRPRHDLEAGGVASDPRVSPRSAVGKHLSGQVTQESMFWLSIMTMPVWAAPRLRARSLSSRGFAVRQVPGSEDSLWADTVLQLGWRVHYTPVAQVWHGHHSSPAELVRLATQSLSTRGMSR